jgi:hypothetical protein
MAYGLQCFDAAGNLTFQISDQLFRVLGVVGIGTSDGSFSDPALADGIPAAFFVADASTIYVSPWQPRVYVSGTTVVYSFNPVNQGTRTGGYIIYGIY